jgi:hypothetical protein
VKRGSLEKIDGLTASVEEINMVLNLIVSAYLLFDPNGNGYISRESVQGMIEEGKGKNSNAMLSQDRWGEMVSASFAYLSQRMLTSFNINRTGMLMDLLISPSLCTPFLVGWIWREKMKKRRSIVVWLKKCKTCDT